MSEKQASNGQSKAHFRPDFFPSSMFGNEIGDKLVQAVGDFEHEEMADIRDLVILGAVAYKAETTRAVVDSCRPGRRPGGSERFQYPIFKGKPGHLGAVAYKAVVVFCRPGR